MKFNQLIVTSNASRTRVGRGIAAGKGKTAGRGTKGQKSRTGHGKKEGFEGGQTPMMKRTPKLRGFRSIRPKAEVVYTSDLNQFKGAVTNETMYQAGLISSAYSKVKIVVRGDITAKVDVVAQGASEKAKEAIQKAGGSFTSVERLKRTAKPKAD